MLASHRPARRLTGLAIAALFVTAACGGSDIAGGDATSATTSDTTAETTPATDPPVTEPVATDPPATDPPVTEPVATDPPVTEPPVTEAAVAPTAEFCDASRSFFLPTSAIDFVEDNDTAALRSLFEEMQARVAPAIAVASDPNSEAQATRASELLDVLTSGLDEIDYDIGRFSEVPQVLQAIDEFGDISLNLETFLVDACDIPISDLDNAARSLAESVATIEPTIDSIPVGDTGGNAGPLDVSDDSGDILVSIPAEWSEVDGTPDGELRQIVAAADVDAFLNSYSEPGVLIFVGQSDEGAAAAEAAIDGATTSAESDGCSVVTSEPYADGVYTGTENTLVCEDTTTITYFISGTNTEEDLFFLVALIHNSGEERIRDLIANTFLVD